MNRLYKPFLIVTYLLLFGAFTSISFGQPEPADTDTDVAITTTYFVEAGLGGAPLTDGDPYDLYVLNAAGDAIIGAKFDFTYNNDDGNTGDMQ